MLKRKCAHECARSVATRTLVRLHIFASHLNIAVGLLFSSTEINKMDPPLSQN